MCSTERAVEVSVVAEYRRERAVTRLNRGRGRCVLSRRIDRMIVVPCAQCDDCCYGSCARPSTRNRSRASVVATWTTRPTVVTTQAREIISVGIETHNSCSVIRSVSTVASAPANYGTAPNLPGADTGPAPVTPDASAIAACHLDPTLPHPAATLPHASSNGALFRRHCAARWQSQQTESVFNARPATTMPTVSVDDDNE